jgi:hypothetical protein
MRKMSTLKRIKKIEIEKFLARKTFLSFSKEGSGVFDGGVFTCHKRNECEKGPTDPFLGCQTK